MFRRIIALIVCVAFISTNLHYSYAQSFNISQLPAPGKMVEPALNFMPLTLKGLVLHPDDALKFDFLMDTGNTGLQGGALKDEALKVMTYFLTALTMKEDDMWVNLSPYEEGKVIEKTFGNTVMGRDLLAEDYILKQLTASLIYPERELGQTFWREVYSKIDPSQLDDSSVDTINKVWIVPSEAVVWEHDGKVMIVKSHLRVMLDQDYTALKSNNLPAQDSQASQIVRDVILPVLEKQVNKGEHFARLRQMYQAMILATWYKKALKESIIAKVYANQGKIKGVDNPNVVEIDAIYEQYLEAFKKGAFNYIKEDVDPVTGAIIPRKYFSGGFTLKMGIVSLATALAVWSGTPTPVQAAEIAQSAKSVGTTVLVQGSAAEVDGKGQPIILAQGKSQNYVSTTPSIQSNELTKEEIWNLLLRAGKDRLTGLGQLIRVGKPAIPVLLEGLRADDRGIRWASVTALGELGDESIIPDLLEMLKREGYQINIPPVTSFKKLDQTTITALVGVLQSRDAIQSSAAVIILKGINDKRTISLLLETLKSEAWYARRSAAEVLIKVGDKSAVPGLLEALNSDTHYSVNYLIAEALAQIGDKSAVPAMLAALKQPGVSRGAIIKALGKMGDKSAVPGLLEELKAESWSTRRSAAEALGQLKDNRAVAGLLELLKDKNPGVQQASVEALLNFGTTAYPDLMRAAISNYTVSTAVIKAGERATPLLMEALKDNSPAVRLSALGFLERLKIKNVTPELEKAVSDSNQDIRRKAVNILSSIGDKTAVPGLINALRSGHQDILDSSIKSLGEIRDEAAIPDLVRFLNSRDFFTRIQAKEALVKIGLPTVPVLMGVIKDRDSQMRQSAIEVLGEVGDKTAIPLIREALSDNVSSVNKAATEALNKLEATWWQRRSNFNQRLLILLASGLGFLGGLGLIGYLKSATHKKKVINKFILENNVNAIKDFLNDGDDLVREEARKALDALVKNSELQYQLGMDHLEGFSDNRAWAIGMLAKSRKNTVVNLIATRLNDYSLKEAARKALDLLLIDSKSQYQMGLDQLENKFVDNKVWAIAMLAKSRDSRAIGHIVKFIERDLLIGEDYLLFNAASDALFLFGDDRSRFLYIERTRTEYEYQQGYDGSYQWYDMQSPPNERTESYWEKVERPASQGSQVSSNRNGLVGISAMAAILSLGSTISTDVQAAQFIDLISNLPEYFSKHQNIIPISLAALVGLYLGIGYVLIKWDNYKEKLVKEKLADIEKYAQLNQPNRIIELLDDNDSRVRAAARANLSNLQLDPETQYQLGVEEIGKRGSTETDKIWAIRMLIKSDNKNIAEIIGRLLGDRSDTVRYEARQFLTRHVKDPKVQYNIGIQQLYSVHFDNQTWAIMMIEKSKDSRAIEYLANVLNWPLRNDSDYVLYNMASDALLSFGDSRSEYRYVYQEEEGHGEGLFEHPYYVGPAEWVVDKEAYWEKVKRSEIEDPANQKPDQLGGIALDSGMMDLQIRRDGNGVPLPVSQQPLDQINLQGFVPQISDIRSINLNEFLGLNSKTDQTLAQI